jgi:predicted kinase
MIVRAVATRYRLERNRVAVAGVRFTVHPHPAAVREARQRVVSLRDLPDEADADAQLVVSELEVGLAG